MKMINQECLRELCQFYSLNQKSVHIRAVESSSRHRLWYLTHCKDEFLLKAFNYSESEKMIAATKIAHHMLSYCIPTRVPLQGKAGTTIFAFSGQYFQLFPWLTGRTKAIADTSAANARWVGNLLADIHNIDKPLSNVKLITWPDYYNFKWASYFGSYVEGNVEALDRYSAYYHQAKEIVTNDTLLSHGDLIPQNIIWADQQPQIIDWELAGLINRNIELLGVALNWAGITTGSLDKLLFQYVLQGYCEQAIQRPFINQDVIYAGFGSWLAWLVFNLQVNDTKEIETTFKAMATLADNIKYILTWAIEIIQNMSY